MIDDRKEKCLVGLLASWKVGSLEVVSGGVPCNRRARFLRSGALCTCPEGLLPARRRARLSRALSPPRRVCRPSSFLRRRQRARAGFARRSFWGSTSASFLLARPPLRLLSAPEAAPFSPSTPPRPLLAPAAPSGPGWASGGTTMSALRDVSLQDPRLRYELIQRIGSGTYGDVYKVRKRRRAQGARPAFLERVPPGARLGSRPGWSGVGSPGGGREQGETFLIGGPADWQPPLFSSSSPPKPWPTSPKRAFGDAQRDRCGDLQLPISPEPGVSIGLGKGCRRWGGGEAGNCGWGSRAGLPGACPGLSYLFCTGSLFFFLVKVLFIFSF